MMSYRFSYFDKFIIEVNGPRNDLIVKYFLEELKYHRSRNSRCPRIGVVYIVPEVNIPVTASILKNDTIYFEKDAIYYDCGKKKMSVKAKPDHFEVFAMEGMDPFQVFYFAEVLTRLYATTYGIVFLHASAFQMMSRTFVINALGGAGKTNLLLACLSNGGVYLGDDLVGADTGGNVYPYRKRINLLYYNFEYRPELLGKVGLSPYMLRTMGTYSKLARHAPLRVCRFLARRRHFQVQCKLNVKVDYKRLAIADNNVTKLPIDKFVWLEESNGETGIFDVTIPYFVSRMTMCLDLENTYFGHAMNYMEAVFPRLAGCAKKQEELVEKAARANSLIGVRKKKGEERQLFDFIADLR